MECNLSRTRRNLPKHCFRRPRGRVAAEAQRDQAISQAQDAGLRLAGNRWAIPPDPWDDLQFASIREAKYGLGA
jgi:hypothetical protein